LGRLSELKREVAELEARAKGEPPTEPAPAQTDNADGIKAAIERMLNDNNECPKAEEQDDKVCPSCYRCQPQESESCNLCGDTPDKWLPAQEPTVRKGGGLDEAAVLRNWKKWLSTTATVEHLQYLVSKSSGNDWKVKYAAKILRLLGAPVPLDFYGENVDAGEPETAPEPDQGVTITNQQVQSAMRYLDIQGQKIQDELDELRKDGTA
jgi:hypothetical protein